MTILESLVSLTSYPIPSNAIEKICVDRELTSGDTYTVLIGTSAAYRLAVADLYMWMFGAPSITEQDISISVGERGNYLKLANSIYGELGDARFSGTVIGFTGDLFN